MIEPANAQTLTRPAGKSSLGRSAAHPSNDGSSEEHVKRALYQNGHVWGQILLPVPELPPLTN